MGTPKFTPGPWKYKADENIITDGRGAPVLGAYDLRDDADGSASAANAVLGALAPEFYDLLARLNTAFYVTGTAKAMREVMAESAPLLRRARGEE